MTAGRAALVTAGSGRIGRAVVAGLLDGGVADRVLAADVAAPAGPLPAGAEAVVCDLRDPAGLAALAERLPDTLTVLVNVLGGERRPALAPVEDPGWMPDEVWDDILDLNLTSAYRVTRLVRDRLAPGAAVCSVSSIAATVPWAVCPAYGAAKAALEHWSSSLAVQLAPRGIRVNLVRPGFVWSPQWAAVDRGEFDRVVADRVPLRRPGSAEQTAEDVAAAVRYLCSDAAGHVTGQAINIDGGATLVRAAR